MKMYDYCLDAEKIKADGTSKKVAYMVMEYAAKGDLMQLLKKKAFSADTSRFFFQ